MVSAGVSDAGRCSPPSIQVTTRSSPPPSTGPRRRCSSAGDLSPRGARSSRWSARCGASRRRSSSGRASARSTPQRWNLSAKRSTSPWATWIREGLRLYPPTWPTARTPVEDDTLGGYTIPAGTLVLLSPYLTHRHPDIWAAPDRFDPDRFTSERAAARHAFAHFPFGGGPRRCVGSAFATIEMQLIVSAMAQRYRLTVLPSARIVPIAGLTLRPSPSVPIQLQRARAD